jgi:hypothetical protein
MPHPLLPALAAMLLSAAPVPPQAPAPVPAPAPPMVPAAPAPAPRPEIIPPDLPPGLPRYEMDVRLDTAARTAEAVQKVTFTNRSAKPVENLVFHVYPRFRPPPEAYKDFARLAMFFKISPADFVDRQGRRIDIAGVWLGDKPLPFVFSEQLETIMIVPLPAPLAPGASVTVRLAWKLSIPEKIFRFGQWKGVTSLTQWYPLLAHHGDQGWDYTPFIPWHQPYFNEMGVYTVRLTLPAEQIVCASGPVIEEKDAGGGYKTVVLPAVARDFAIAASADYRVYESEADGVQLRVSSLPGHERYALFALQVLEEVVPLYNEWFGRYPFPIFSVAETYFGYNGNETGNMVLIDQRMFALPWIGRRYFDQLLSHETMHQWWYNVVGTHGFAEPWMDEGLVNHMTNVRMRAKYGVNAELFQWPPILAGFPNIGTEDLAQKGYYKRVVHDKDLPVLQNLIEYGGLDALFDVAYDKGGRVMGMIHWRMGDEAWYRFLRTVYAKHKYRILRVADFKRELEAFTGRPWDKFWEEWLQRPGLTDWALERVSYGAAAEEGGRRTVTIDVRQEAEIFEPTDVRVTPKAGGAPVTLRLDPDRGPEYRIPEADAVVRRVSEREWRIELRTDSVPGQVEIDPDYRVLDIKRFNNRRIPAFETRISPLYLSLDDDPFFNPFDKITLQAGPYVESTLPEIGGVGLKVGAQQAYLWRAYALAGYVVNTQEWVTGTRVEIWKTGLKDTTLGFEYLHSLTTDVSDRQIDRGRVWLRYSPYRFTAANGLLPEPEFLEVYARSTRQVRNEAPDPPPGLDPLINRTAVGIAYRNDTRYPYWDPEIGSLVTAYYETGFRILGGERNYNAFGAEYAVVRKLPEGLGYFSNTKIAARVLGEIAPGSPNAQVFQLGGATRYRGVYPATRQGNALWLASVEYRFPLLKDVDVEFPYIDNLFTLKGVNGAVFYDIADVYQDGSQAIYQKGPSLSSGRISHAVGAGLRFDLAFFSFLERAQFRVDFAKDISTNQPLVVWFSLQQPF